MSSVLSALRACHSDLPPSSSSLLVQERQLLQLCNRVGNRTAWAKPQRCTRRAARHSCRLQAAAAGLEAVVQTGPGGVRVQQADQAHGRRVFAEVSVQASVEQVWRVLTDYDRLAEFVPNLSFCERIHCDKPGRIRLRQRGCSQSVFWRLEAQAVLEVTEVFKPMDRREVQFMAVEGDFQEYRGRWTVQADPRASLATLLRYEIFIAPRLSIPSAIVTCVVRAGLPRNILAIAKRAEQLAEQRRKFPRFSAAALREFSMDRPFFAPASSAEDQSMLEELPGKGPMRKAWQTLQGAGREFDVGRKLYLGLMSVPIPFGQQPAAEAASEAPDRPARGSKLGHAWRQISRDSSPTELHLRRLDDSECLHRRLVAALTVDATPEEIWEVLTDYEALPEFIPNLAICERQAVTGKPAGIQRIRQVGFKRMMYMCLHAESLLDLYEKRAGWEIQFKQVKGDFTRFQGKWILQPVEAQDRASPSQPQTVLRYAVEVQVARSTRMTAVLEPLLESVVYEDLPANLGALKQRVERLRPAPAAAPAQDDAPRTSRFGRKAHAPLAGSDLEVLEAELLKQFSGSRQLPTRQELREANRSDLERAIHLHGGHTKVAEALGWQLAYKGRKPRGYWDVLANVQAEVEEFVEDHNLPLRVLPAKAAFIKAGRYDLVRTVERWGGTWELAAALEYKVPEGRARGGPVARSKTMKIQRAAAVAAAAAAGSHGNRRSSAAAGEVAGATQGHRPAAAAAQGSSQALAASHNEVRAAKAQHAAAAGGNGAGKPASGGNGSAPPAEPHSATPTEKQLDHKKQLSRQVRDEIDRW